MEISVYLCPYINSLDNTPIDEIKYEMDWLTSIPSEYKMMPLGYK